MKGVASILIVDDNISLCKTMSLILSRKGFSVTIAEDGPEAIEKVKESPFDLIFMDIKMLPIDGVETYRRVAKIRPDVVVTMMTGDAVDDLVHQALQEGAYGVLYKPLDMGIVVDFIYRVGEGEPACSFQWPTGEQGFVAPMTTH